MKLHRLNRANASRVRQQLVSEVEGEPEPERPLTPLSISPSAFNQPTVPEFHPLPRTEIVKGYECEKDRYVTIEDRELEIIEPRTSREMEIVEFVKFAEIDPVYLESSYYVAPDQGGEKPYSLLFGALRRTGYVALARIAMHNREHVAVIRPGSKGILMHTMYFVDEVRKDQEFQADTSRVTEKEMDLAVLLVDALAAAFEPEKFKDTYREKLKAMIEAKALDPKARPGATVERLKKSIAIARKPVASEAVPARGGEPVAHKMVQPFVWRFLVCAALPFLCAAAELIIPLNVGSGVPLRLYLTKRISKRVGDPVRAKVIEPVFAFDREVIPAGSDVVGHVSRLDRVSKAMRASAVIGGDFTPLHRAQVEFTELVLPDGRKMALRTVETTGLISLFDPRPPKKQKKQKKQTQPTGTGSGTGILGTGKQQIEAQVKGQINARARGVADLVHGPDKKDRLEEFLIAKLPYHPQWVRKGTRFDAVLRDPLAFGTAAVNTDALKQMGTQPPSDSVVHARLLVHLDSGTAKLGQPVEAVVSQPLFSAANQLILPAGSRLTGAVTLVRRARWFHRGGQIRFSFQKVDLPPDTLRFVKASAEPIKIAAKLESAEGGRTPIKVDEEGGVKTDEPKTRLIAPAISVLIAAKTLDNDENRRGIHEGESNPGGRSLGGFSGFGLLGTIAAQSSRNVGSALGFYGMAVSVYTNIVARGPEIEFADNAAMDIRFGSRPPLAAPAAKKFKTQAFSKSSAAEFMQ